MDTNTAVPETLNLDPGITGTVEEDHIKITRKAVEEVRKVRDQNSIDPDFGLRIGVKGGGCSGMSYTLGFDASPRADDLVLEADGVKVYIDRKSVFYLLGVTLDFSDGLMGRGFTFNNPGASKTCGCGSSFSA